MATHCDYFAMFLFVQRYIKKISPFTARAVKAKWAKKNTKWLNDAPPDWTPSMVATAYLDPLGLSNEDLDDQLDWHHFEQWPDDTLKGDCDMRGIRVRPDSRFH